MKALYDGDILLYKHCKNAEQTIDFGDDQQMVVSDSREARQKMIIDLESINKDLETWLKHPLEIVIAFSDLHANWRKSILPSYKAKRVGKGKPTSYKAVRDWFLTNYDSRMESELEGDDILGILSTTDVDDCIVVSWDKDLLTIPGFLFNPDKNSQPKLITLEQANHNHMTQTLTGDLVDGFKGCPRYGPKKALQALGPPEGNTVPKMWDAVIKAYTTSGLTVEDAVVQAKVARILRRNEWDQEKKQCLWEPPILAPVEIQNVPCAIQD